MGQRGAWGQALARAKKRRLLWHGSALAAIACILTAPLLGQQQGGNLFLFLFLLTPPPQLSRLGVAADWGFEGGRRLEGQRAMAWPRPTAPSARCSVPPTAACLETASVPGAIGVGVSQCERHFGFELGFAFQNRGWRPCEALSASEEISPASNRAALSAFMFSISEVAAFPPLGE